MILIKNKKKDYKKIITKQMFNEKICILAKCPNMPTNTILPACFANPEDCEINQKAGYPKEVKNDTINKIQ